MVQGPDCRDWKSGPRLNSAAKVDNPLAHGLALSMRCIAETAAICVPTIYESVRGTLTPEAIDQRLERWAGRVLDRADVELHVQGTIPQQGGPFVVMSNHSSFYDIPVVYHLFGGRLRMVAKKELFDVPVFGRAIRDAGMVCVDRKNRQNAIESFAVARAQIRTGISIWIAPEGTRSADGTLGPLKKGGFVLALQTQRPILPITVRGTHRVLPRGSVRVRPSQRVEVLVHEPIEVSRLPVGTDAELRASRDELLARVATVLGGSA